MLNIALDALLSPPLCARRQNLNVRSERSVTASPSIRALSAAKLQTASATFGNLSVKFVPF